MKHSFFLTLLTFLISASSFSQSLQRPVPIELMAGNERAYFAFGIDKQIYKNFWYNNITTVTSEYDFKKSRTELVSVNTVNYKLHKTFSLGGGIQWHFIKGLIPNISATYAYGNPTFLVVVAPYLDFMPHLESETLAILEYKPKLTNNLRLFTRAQGLYGHNLEKNIHERSFYYFRLGLTIGRKFTVGAAANLDYYGPKKMERTNFGGFFKVNL